MAIDGFYDDGYVAEATISKIPGAGDKSVDLRVPLTFTYRPMGVVDANRYFSKIEAAADNPAAAEVMVDAIVAHVDSWSRMDRAGAMVPINKESCRRMSAPLVTRMLEVITGRGAPDDGGINLDAETKN